MTELSVNDYSPLDPENAEILLKLITNEHYRKQSRENLEIIPDDQLPFLSVIVKRRVQALHLPVMLTNSGLLGVNCFVDNPGKAVVLLIDFLTKYENQELTVEKLCQLYPWGFYCEEKFDCYVDEIKTRKSKWSEIY